MKARLFLVAALVSVQEVTRTPHRALDIPWEVHEAGFQAALLVSNVSGADLAAAEERSVALWPAEDIEPPFAPRLHSGLANLSRSMCRQYLPQRNVLLYHLQGVRWEA